MDKILAQKLSGIELLAKDRIATCLQSPYLAEYSERVRDPQFDLFKPQTRKEFEPHEDDFIAQSFRAISKRYLGPEGYYLDFSRDGVLENALGIFLHKDKGGSRLDHLKLVKNHGYKIEDHLGPIINAWLAANDATLGSGGINVTAKIDWKLHPGIARGFLATPPLYDNTSISFVGSTEQSHRTWIGFNSSFPSVKRSTAKSCAGL